MIEEYLQRIDELLSASPVVSGVEVVRRSIRDTELEKVLNYRYNVVSHPAIKGLEVLQHVLADIETRESVKGG
jgi:hypothetical protein